MSHRNLDNAIEVLGDLKTQWKELTTVERASTLQTACYYANREIDRQLALIEDK